MNAIESLASPCWEPRIACLAAIVGASPAFHFEICDEAQTRFGWDPAFTINVLAAGEKTSFGSSGRKWWRLASARVDASHVETSPAARGVQTYGPRQCALCEAAFVPTRGKQRFCSSRCQSKYWRVERAKQMRAA